MRILVDLLESKIEALDELSKSERKSRAAIIREAIDEYLARQRTAGEEDAFGLWGRRKIDGLAYQNKVRREW